MVQLGSTLVYCRECGGMLLYDHECDVRHCLSCESWYERESHGRSRWIRKGPTAEDRARQAETEKRIEMMSNGRKTGTVN